MNIAAMGSDMDAILAFQRIAQRGGHEVVSQPSSDSQFRGGRSPQPPLKREAKSEAKPEDVAVELLSAVGVDYSNLQKLLVERKWKEADAETARIMLKVAGREKEGWLDTDSINKFPCENLRTIDQLWVKYSNGRFGFSVQKRIWLEVGGKPGEYDEKFWEKFGDRVGWRVKNDWIPYSDLTFSINAPWGHLPCGGCGGGVGHVGGHFFRLFRRLGGVVVVFWISCLVLRVVELVFGVGEGVLVFGFLGVCLWCVVWCVIGCRREKRKNATLRALSFLLFLSSLVQRLVNCNI